MKNVQYMQRVATRIAFFIAGIGMSVWAALVPFVKTRIDLRPAELGMLLLCLGMGSLIAMPLTGFLALRVGCRPLILIAGALICVLLPILSWALNALTEAATLVTFGAAMGMLDVAMNIEALMVEKAHGTVLMSGFHGLFSAGGFIGAGGMSLLLWLGLGPLASAGSVTAILTVMLLGFGLYMPGMPTDLTSPRPRFAIPRGVVSVIGLLCFIVFLAEGAILDWSAILLTTVDKWPASQGGIGYSMFAVAMTVGRLTGDSAVRTWGRKRLLLAGALCSAAGFVTAAAARSPWVALGGLLLVGVGVSNIVPILFTVAGRQSDMPSALAISTVTTLGYSGVLLGPALIGFIATASNLPIAFATVGAAMILVARFARLPSILQVLA